MQLSEAISLIENAPFPQSESRWADLGCGEGLFTQALASCLKAGSVIHAVDIKKNFRRFDTSNVIVEFLEADFVKESLPISSLDAVLMANAFHYVKDKRLLLSKLKQVFQGKPKFIFIEYDTNVPLPVWVPYPMSFDTMNKFFLAEGYSKIIKLSQHPSIYGRADMYSAWVE